jgi:hypothetical protein
VNKAITLLLASVLLLLPGSAFAQRFGGDFGGGGGFWLLYVDLGIEEDRSFGRDVGAVVALGGRGFLQTGKIRLGGGAFGGGFTDEGLNSVGNKVQGGFSAGGFTAEYLVLQQNLEIIVGGMVGGGVLTIEERISVTGEIEELRRRRDSMFVGYPWVRVGYNPAPFVNVGLQLGYLVGTGDVGGFAVGLDIMAGLIP